MTVPCTVIPRPTVTADEMARLGHAALVIYHNTATGGRCLDCRVRHFTGRMLCDECIAAKRAGFIRVPMEKPARRSVTPRRRSNPVRIDRLAYPA
jgi:hypothetical protein